MRLEDCVPRGREISSAGLGKGLRPLAGGRCGHSPWLSQLATASGKPALGGRRRHVSGARPSLPWVPSCLLTRVSFIRILLHQIPNEIFCCSKRSTGEESVCGLRHDGMTRRGLSERRVSREGYGTGPPRTPRYTEREAPAFGEKESQGVGLSVETCQRRDSHARPETLLSQLEVPSPRQPVTPLVQRCGCKVPGPPTGSRTPTGVRDVIPVGGVELVFGLEDLFEELGVIFIIKRRVATEPARQDGVRACAHGAGHLPAGRSCSPRRGDSRAVRCRHTVQQEARAQSAQVAQEKPVTS